MGDLIWIGNVLLPRGLVFATVGLIALVAIVAFVIATEQQP